MRIMLDGYNLSLPEGTGVATYGRNLSKIIKSLGYQVDIIYGGKSTRYNNPLLSEIAFFDAVKVQAKGLNNQIIKSISALAAPLGCRIDYVPISGNVIFDSLRNQLPEFDNILNSINLYHRCSQSFIWLKKFAKIQPKNIDIVHWTYPLPIYASNCINVYTLHDLIPLKLPQTTLNNKNNYFKICKRIVDTADHVITVSENSRKDIIELLGANPEKVTNTYQSVSFPKKLMNKSDEVVRNELAGTFKLKYKGYFLFFGAIEPKKNLGRLIEAYMGSAITTPLVIVGGKGWSSEEELRLYNSLKSFFPKYIFSKRIIRLDYLPRPILVTIIRGAKVTLFPSLYEGFGLPILESMLLGTAVITSHTSSIQEVAGDAAYLVDPYDTQAIVQAIRELDTNDELRMQMEVKGRKQSELFSEGAYSRRINDLYCSLLANKLKYGYQYF